MLFQPIIKSLRQKSRAGLKEFGIETTSVLNMQPSALGNTTGSIYDTYSAVVKSKTTNNSPASQGHHRLFFAHPMHSHHVWQHGFETPSGSRALLGWRWNLFFSHRLYRLRPIIDNPTQNFDVF